MSGARINEFDVSNYTTQISIANKVWAILTVAFLSSWIATVDDKIYDVRPQSCLLQCYITYIDVSHVFSAGLLKFVL